jgi:hypothetical protein
MVGHAPVINKRKSVNYNKVHRRLKASARKTAPTASGMVVPRRSSKKLRQVEKRLRHNLQDAKAAALAAGFAAEVAAEMEIDDGLRRGKKPAKASAGKAAPAAAAAGGAAGDVDMAGGK